MRKAFLLPAAVYQGSVSGLANCYIAQRSAAFFLNHGGAESTKNRRVPPWFNG